jgi:putative ABC transport system permease protein
MLRNYIAATFRNIARNKLTAAINILGLAVGFTTAMLIALYVHDELTFDAWLPGHETVYRLGKELRPPGVAPMTTNAAGPAEAGWFAQLPHVVAATRLWPEDRSLRHGTAEAIENVVWADPNVFEVFPYPVVDGNLAGALTAPGSVVLTRATAVKYFGTHRAVGKTLEVDRAHPLTVTAVLEDLPARSHLDLRVLISARTAISPTVTTPGVDNPSIGLGPTLTYLKLRPGTLEEVRDAAPGLLDRYTKPFAFGPEKTVPTRELVTYEYQPLAGIHMMSQAGRAAQGQSTLLRAAGDPGILRALLLTGVLLLFIAVANFTNLMTAHAPRRSTEIGVRKSVGALRRDLMAQFLGESFLYVGVAFIAAVFAAIALMPAVSALVGREIGLADKGLWLVIVPALVLIVTGLLGGAYPAYILSRFSPASALKVSAKVGRGAGLVRESLVIGQFAVLIGLLVATAIIGRQTAFATQTAIRAEADQLVIAGSPCTEEFRVRVTALPGVRGASCVSRSLFGGFGAMRLMTNPDGTQFNLHNVFADPGALELYGLVPVAGRFFQAGDDQTRQIPGRRAPARRVLINETAARKLGFASPDAAIGDDVHGQGLDVIGVVPDFQIAVRSPKDAIEAIVFSPASMVGGMARMDPPLLLIKLDGARLGETVRGIDAAWEALGVERPIMRKFVNQHIEEQFQELERQTEAFNAFSLTSVFIACLGLFGLSAHRAEQRTKEIGIRKTMGASSGDVLRLLLWQFTKPVLWANLIAWPAAYFIMRRWLEGFAYRIDLAPWMFLAASALALVIALATVIGHALLVARARPVAALRYE